MEQSIAQLSPGFIQAIMGIVTAILIFIAAKIRQYVNSMDINEKFKKDLLATNDQVLTSIKKVVATSGEELKTKLADGKITEDEIKELHDKVYKEVLTQVPDLENRLNVHMTNGSKYISDTILGHVESANKVTNL